MAREVIYRELVELAREEGLAAYSDVGQVALLDMRDPRDRSVIGTILSEINQYEHNYGRPLLSTVVVLKDEEVSSNGFYKSARALGLFSWRGDKWFWKSEPAQQFWLEQLERVHAHWSGH